VSDRKSDKTSGGDDRDVFAARSGKANTRARLEKESLSHSFCHWGNTGTNCAWSNDLRVQSDKSQASHLISISFAINKNAHANYASGYSQHQYWILIK